MALVTVAINLTAGGEIEDEEAGRVQTPADVPGAVEAVLRKRDVAPGSGRAGDGHRRRRQAQQPELVAR